MFYPPTRQQVLLLYKHLIRYGRQVQFTDKTYFLGRIRREFRGLTQLNDPRDIDFHYKRGEALLRKGRVV